MSESFLRSCRAVLFDLDGVLVDSYDCWFRLLDDFMRRQGKQPLSKKLFDAGWGQGPEVDRRMFFPDWTVEEILSFYEQQFPGYTGFARGERGAMELLVHLRKCQKRIAVASNSPTGIVRALLESAGLIPWVDLLVGVDQVKKGKPSPDLLFKAMEGCNAEPKQVCYVGDSVYDERAASAAGVFFVGYKRDGNVSVQNFAELLQLF